MHPRNAAFADYLIVATLADLNDRTGRTVRVDPPDPQAPFIPQVNYFVKFSRGNTAMYSYQQFGERLHPIAEIIASIEARVPRTFGGVVEIQAFIPFRIQTTNAQGTEYRMTFYTPDDLAKWRGEQPEIAAKLRDLRVIEQQSPTFGAVCSAGRLNLDSWMRQFEIELF